MGDNVKRGITGMRYSAGRPAHSNTGTIHAHGRTNKVERQEIADSMRVPGIITERARVQPSPNGVRSEWEIVYTDPLPELIHDARNIVWSAENGGYNGRPSEVRRILTAILDVIEPKEN